MRRIHYATKRNRGAWGMAYPDERRIEIDPALEGRSKLEILLHESLHVLLPQFPEDVINEFGKTQADLIWRAGFREKDEDS